MKATIRYDENDVIRLIRKDIADKLGTALVPKEINLKVKSINNFRPQEWESGKILFEFTAGDDE